MNKKDSKHSKSSDHALFRKAVTDAKPLKTIERHQAASTPRPPIRSDAPESGDPTDAITIDATDALGEALSFTRAPINRRTMRELRRGKIRPGDEIDLHGLTSKEAKTALNNFIDECLSRNYRCLRVIHGKGLGSGSRGPVLKAYVNQYLRTRQEVMAFCSAPPADGGTGAVYVLMKTR